MIEIKITSVLKDNNRCYTFNDICFFLSAHSCSVKHGEIDLIYWR